jgi:hypothetical protein
MGALRGDGNQPKARNPGEKDSKKSVPEREKGIVNGCESRHAARFAQISFSLP